MTQERIIAGRSKWWKGLSRDAWRITRLEGHYEGQGHATRWQENRHKSVSRSPWPAITSRLTRSCIIRSHVKRGHCNDVSMYNRHTNHDQSKVTKVNVYLYSVRRRWSAQTIPLARHQRTLRDHGYGLVYHAIWLFTSPAFAWYSFQPNHRGRAQAE